MNDYLFGNYIYNLRRNAGVTQTELAVALGVTDKSVSKWENGKAKPSTKVLQKLSAYFGVSIEQLFHVIREVTEDEAYKNAALAQMK